METTLGALRAKYPATVVVGPDDLQVSTTVLKDGTVRATCAVPPEGWERDRQDWGVCYFGDRPRLHQTAIYYGGVLDEDGSFAFGLFDDLLKVLAVFKIRAESPDYGDRLSSVRWSRRENGLVVTVERLAGDATPEKWKCTKNGKCWTRFFPCAREPWDDTDFGRYRAADTLDGRHEGFYILGDNFWIKHPAENIKNSLRHDGVAAVAVAPIMGGLVMDATTLVNLPFAPEYPGGRRWNKDAAQLRHQPVEGVHPTWSMVLSHIGRDLDDCLGDWGQSTGITTGERYLTAWIASIVRNPTARLPYLFLHGPENSGKSIFHEAIAQCLFSRGVVIADRTLTNASDFNGELANCVLAAIEEKDISACPGALAKLKDWVTCVNISIRRLHRDPYQQPNTTH